MDGVERPDDVLGRHLGQEADTAQVDPQNGAIDLGSDPRATQKRPIASERHNETRVACDIGLLPPAAPAFVVTPHVDVRAWNVFTCTPIAHDARRDNGLGAALVDDDSHPLDTHLGPTPRDPAMSSPHLEARGV
ncbi:MULTISPECIES: hypothetical protein [unclassified Streptomyces]|uniref:hypothetical protein n=1 Tax=unclassified Streptomyces TaxID=2593676 RepID=UPI002E81C24B|nr:hypothetical protein [Streptomyces sp. NBC_00562]